MRRRILSDYLPGGIAYSGLPYEPVRRIVATLHRPAIVPAQRKIGECKVRAFFQKPFELSEIAIHGWPVRTQLGGWFPFTMIGVAAA